jgi:hypothetical protein
MITISAAELIRNHERCSKQSIMKQVRHCLTESGENGFDGWNITLDQKERAYKIAQRYFPDCVEWKGRQSEQQGKNVWFRNIRISAL